MAAHTATTTAPSVLARAVTASRCGLLVNPSSFTLATYITGLAVSRCSSWLSAFSSLVSPIERTGLPASRCLLHALEQILLARRILVAALGGLGVAIDRLLHRLQIGERELGVDDVDVARSDSRGPTRARCRRLRNSARRARSHRSRGCARGTCCRGLRPATRRPPGPRCRRTRPWSARSSRARRSSTARRGADRAPARCRRSDRWCRTDSSPPRSARASAR